MTSGRKAPPRRIATWDLGSVDAEKADPGLAAVPELDCQGVAIEDVENGSGDGRRLGRAGREDEEDHGSKKVPESTERG